MIHSNVFKEMNFPLGMCGGIREGISMPHDTLDVRHIAKLARLELDDEEAATFQPQLEAILDHVEALGMLDLDACVTGVESSMAFGLMRDDQPGESLPVESVIANAPDSAQGQIRVPKVVADA